MEETLNKKNHYKIFLKIIIVMAIIARITNFGWYTFIFILGLIPIHMIAFYLINIKISNYACKHSWLKVLIILSSILFLLPYIFYPDVADVGGLYAIFGLIRDTYVLGILKYASQVFFICSVSILLIEIKILFNLNKMEN